MYAYADQNLIIAARDCQKRRNVVIDAQKRGFVQLVLSPFHIYELETVREEEYQSTIDCVDELNPLWSLRRSDLQLREFKREWHAFWKLPTFEFQPIGSLAYIASQIHKKPIDIFLHFSVRDFFKLIRNGKDNQQREKQFQALRQSFEKRKVANEANKRRYRLERPASHHGEDLDRTIVAFQLARMTDDSMGVEGFYEEVEHILETPVLFQKVSIFVENRRCLQLKAHTVENLIVLDCWEGEAVLDEQKQVDFAHAVVALSYCDVFVTSDTRLQKKCERVRSRCEFPLARVVSVEEWIAELETKLRSA